jgi:hypothetical protein
MNPHASDVLLGTSFGTGDVPAPLCQPRQADKQADQKVTYVSVPPKKSVAVSVHYQVRGRGLPLPYEFDEGLDG